MLATLSRVTEMGSNVPTKAVFKWVLHKISCWVAYVEFEIQSVAKHDALIFRMCNSLTMVRNAGVSSDCTEIIQAIFRMFDLGRKLKIIAYNTLLVMPPLS